MGSLAADALFRGLRKGAIESVYYLYGTEDVLKDEAVREIADRVLDASTRDFNFDQPDPAGLDAERVDALLNTPPMLAERRLVVLRGVAQLRRKSRAREALLRYVAAPNPTTVLVLMDPAGEKPADDLGARVVVAALDRLPPERAVRWVAHRAGELGMTFEPAAATHLVDTLEGDLGPIAQEIDKLAAAVRGRPVTRGDVEALIGVRHGETLQALVAAALERRASDAARLVGPVLGQSGMTGVRIVMALGTALLGTAIARAELDRGTSGARLEQVVFRHLLAARPPGLPQWKVAAAQWASWAHAWTLPDLRSALRRALAADRALKTTRLSRDAGIVTELALRCAVIAQEAA